MPGTLVITTLSDGTNSTSATNCIQGSAKAWVTYNGLTQAVLSSYNVSSVTRNATGQYTINFTNAFANTNYCWVASAGMSGSGQGDFVSNQDVSYATWKTTSALKLRNFYAYNLTNEDANNLCVSCFS